jgi:hypothetical protein
MDKLADKEALTKVSNSGVWPRDCSFFISDLSSSLLVQS